MLQPLVGLSTAKIVAASLIIGDRQDIVIVLYILGVCLLNIIKCVNAFSNKYNINDFIFQVYKHRVRDGCRGTINPGPKKYKILNGHYLCLQPQCTSEYPEGAEILNTYSTREKFWKHIESVHSHPEDLLYTCDHCGKKFALKGMLKDHVVKVHDKPVSLDNIREWKYESRDILVFL